VTDHPIRPGELGEEEIARWRHLQDADPELASPFLAPEFAIAVDASRPTARVAVLEEGFFAFEAHRFGVAKPIGAGLSDQQAVVCPPSRTVDTRALAARCGVHALRLENVPATRLPRSLDRVVHYPSPIIDLRDGYPAFLEARRRASKSLVPTVQRKRRKMEREVGPVRFEFDSADPVALRTVMRWKSQQYAELGEWDRFADPAVVALLERLHGTRAPGCTGTLSVLYAGDQIAAAHFGLRSQRALCSWFPTYNPELARYSPGMLLHLLMAEGAAERGVTAFDLGAGEHGRYKTELAAYDKTLARGWGFRATAPGVGHRFATAPAHSIRLLARRSPRVRGALEGARDTLRAAARRIRGATRAPLS
jgi:CelD/BcsL family acetyltransferase involved in cellulose biosynthesis